MKKLIVLIAITITFQLSFAQAPQGFNYQAVARTSAGAAITNQLIGLKISLLQGSASGTLVYSETFSATSNNIGLLNIVVGTGTPLFGTFAAINWANSPYFIEINMDVTGGTNYVIMGTQQLMSVPYALYAQNAPAGSAGATGATGAAGLNGTNGTNGATGATGAGGTNGTNGVNGATGANGTNGATGTAATNNTLNQAYNQGGPGAGSIITANSGPVAINGSGTGAGGIGLLVTQSGTVTSAIGASLSGTGNAITAASTNAANTTSTIQATTNSATLNNSALFGQTTGMARGVTGQVDPAATADVGVYGNNLRTTGGIGVEGIGYNGVSGQSAQELGYGVFGANSHTGGTTGDEAGVAGSGGFAGVEGQSAGGTGYGIASLDNMISIGNFTCLGTKAFTIDHPLDPANKYLKHYTIESPEVLNMYRGNATCDANGEAEVTLPSYFSAININFSYNLTPIGAPAVLFIKEKVNNGRFKVAGAGPGMEFSWQVYAERNDVYVQQHPESKAVEPFKSEKDKGKYLKPELYGQPTDKAIFKGISPKR